jgi:hypothetical protein
MRIKYVVFLSGLVVAFSLQATDHQDEQTPLTLALINGSDDNIIQEIIDRTPALVNTKDQKSGLLPIEIATKTRQAVSLVYRLLLRDLHSDADEIEPNNCLAWFHIISDTSNNYYSLVQDLLKKCSQCQVRYLRTGTILY